MARSVIWSEPALDDLDAAAGFIAKDSRIYASAFVYDVREASRSLRTFSERGRVVPEFGNPTIRELIVGSYRLIYRVGEAKVEILTIVHGSRDLLAFWKRRSSP